MKTFWIISVLWLVACGVALWWTLPRIEAAEQELEAQERAREAESLDDTWDGAA